MINIDQEAFEEMKARVMARVEDEIVRDILKHYRNINTKDIIISQVTNKVVKEIKRDISLQVNHHEKIKELLDNSEHFTESAIKARINSSISGKVDALIEKLKDIKL